MSDARAELTDPNTSAQRLFELAQSNPELGTLIAAHPNAYPALQEWIAQYAAPQTPPPAEPAVPGAAQPAVAQPTVEQPTVAQPTVAQPTVAQPTVPQPYAPGSYAAPPQYAAPTIAPHTVPQPYGAQAPTQALFPEQPAAPRSKKPFFIILAACIVVALLAIGGIAWAVIGSKVGGSPTPEAAATKMVDGLTSLDPLTIYGSFAPSEISAFMPALERLGDMQPAEGDGRSLTDSLGALKNALNVQVSDITTEAEEIADGVQRVSYIGGTITIDGDEEVVTDALADLMAYGMGVAGVDLDDARADALAELRGTVELPQTIDLADFSIAPLQNLSVVSVQESGSWYVSPLLTQIDSIYVDASGYSNLPSPARNIVAAAPADSPEAAAAALADALINGSLDEVAAHLPLPERRALSLYGPAFEMAIEGWNHDLELEAAEFTAERGGSSARLQIENLSVSGMLYGGYFDDKLTLNMYEHCVNAEYYDAYWDETSFNSMCLDEMLPGDLYTELGIDEVALIAVREDGGWFVSPLATLADISSSITAHVVELNADGRLEAVFERAFEDSMYGFRGY